MSKSLHAAAKRVIELQDRSGSMRDEVEANQALIDAVAEYEAKPARKRTTRKKTTAKTTTAKRSSARSRKA